MKKRFKIFGFGVTALLLLGVAWNSFAPGIANWEVFAGTKDPLAANAPPFVWFKSGVIAKNHGSMGFAKRLYWLDNDTIYFSGHRLPKSDRAGGVDRREIKNSLYEWRVGKPARIYTTEWDRRILCANWGVIKYSVWEKKMPDGGTESLMKYGHPGQEKSILKKLSEFHIPPPKGTVSLGAGPRCKYPIRPEMEGKKWKTLLPEHGYVEQKVIRNADLYSRPFILYPPGKATGIELPIPSVEATLYCVKYHPFIGAYLFWNCITSSNPAGIGLWKQNNCWAYWLLWPDGRTKRNCIPHGDWVGGTISLVMTKKGAFFSSNHPVLKHAGGFLISNGKVSRLMRGYLMFPDVSPNGCRVAFSYTEITKGSSWRAAPGPRYRARAIDLCVSDMDKVNSGDRPNGNSTR